MNNSLVTLILDSNTRLGSVGTKNLCKGICTNSRLKKLSLKYCGIDQDGGDPLAEMLLFPKIGLTILELGGNKLGGEGLFRICRGLAQNSSLTCLGISDNQIWGSRDLDVKGLSLFASCVSKHPGLKEINLLHNPIEEIGALALLPTVAENNPHIERFLLDKLSSFSDDLFRQLYRDKAPVAKKVRAKKKKTGNSK